MPIAIRDQMLYLLKLFTILFRDVQYHFLGWSKKKKKLICIFLEYYLLFVFFKIMILLVYIKYRGLLYCVGVNLTHEKK